MSRFYRWIFIGILLSLSCGCASVYQPLSQGAYAYISAPTKGMLSKKIIIIYRNASACKSPTVGTFSQRMHGVPIRITADQLTTITVEHPIPGKTLKFTFTFIPQDGYSYIIVTKTTRLKISQLEVKMRLLGASEQDQANNLYHLVPFVKRNLAQGLLVSQSTYANKLLQQQLYAGQYYYLPKTTVITQIVNKTLAIQI